MWVCKECGMEITYIRHSKERYRLGWKIGDLGFLETMNATEHNYYECQECAIEFSILETNAKWVD